MKHIALFPEFTPLSIEHRGIFESYLQSGALETSETNFAELFLWGKSYKPFISMLNGNLCIKVEKPDRIYFYSPVGEKHVPETIFEILKWQKTNFGKARIVCVSEKTADEVSRKFAGVSLSHDDGQDEYVYLASTLSELKGSKFDGKRNHVKKFEQKNNYDFVPIDKNVADECLKLQEEWCAFKKCEQNELLMDENEAIMGALEKIGELPVFGAAIKVSGKIQAFTIASRLNKDTALVMFEKANSTIDGIYQAINKYFARMLSKEYIYINREQDHGIEGLRKAKLSYHPHHMVKKYNLIYD